MIRRLLIAATILAFFPSSGFAETIEEFLDKFHQDPKKMMDRLPSEVDSRGYARPRGFINERLVDETLKHKNSIRAEIMSRSIISDPRDPRSIDLADPDSTDSDRPERLVEAGGVLTNLEEMARRGLTRRSPRKIPWADTYWPLYKGLTGIRYNDRGFPKSKSWVENYQYVQSHPATGIFNTGNNALIDNLSPAEKYDLAMGDMSLSLTNFAWAQGRRHQDEKGFVPPWTGYCHGWAAAAHMEMPIPESPVTVISTTGIPITFYPQDLKGLQAMAWANSGPTTRFVGARCKVSRPPKNRYGRIMDPKCFDVNPATWHMALTNQMGIHGRSFVMDSTFDYEVWNFPLAGYAYRYFNPADRKEAGTLKGALVPLEKYQPIDYFRDYRSPRAKYVVGIYMDLSHVDAQVASRSIRPNPPIKTLRFVYDLELDADLNIVGGEWYSNAHPDFIWTHDAAARPMAPGDADIAGSPWSTSSPIPGNWLQPAMRSSNRGAPLFTFIKGISP